MEAGSSHHSCELVSLSVCVCVCVCVYVRVRVRVRVRVCISAEKNTCEIGPAHKPTVLACGRTSRDVKKGKMSCL